MNNHKTFQHSSLFWLFKETSRKYRKFRSHLERNIKNGSIKSGGLSDSGHELPEGTYFYRIELVDGTPVISGFFVLNE